MFDDPRFFLTAYEVADFFRISRNYTYYLLHIGELPGFKVGYYWRIPVFALEQYISNKLEQRMVIVNNNPAANIK